MADLYRVKQAMVGDLFSYRPEDVIEWPAVNEIPGLIAAGILEPYVPEPVKAETAENAKAKKKETR